MQMGAITLRWHEVAAAPEMPGIYAWYFKPELTDFDISSLIASLEGESAKCDDSFRRKLVRDFLVRRIFCYFEQKPYLVELSGQLKPKYRGEVDHQPDLDLSDALIDRILLDPTRLYRLKRPLDETTPMFASPLYIGMADKSLRVRLTTHKRLISSMENTAAYTAALIADYELSFSDKTFAERVRSRGIPSSRLFVVLQAVDSSHDPNDIENILNRIYFPVLGRN